MITVNLPFKLVARPLPRFIGLSPAQSAAVRVSVAVCASKTRGCCCLHLSVPIVFVVGQTSTKHLIVGLDSLDFLSSGVAENYWGHDAKIFAIATC